MKQKTHVLVGPLSYLRGDADVGYGRPGIEEIVEELHEIALADLASLLFVTLLLFCYHFEGNPSLVKITSAF